jgi:hypothetical protein
MNVRTKVFLTSREPTPEESASRREISTAISRALPRLPDNLRTPYKLHAISGLPLVDVANRMGLSPVDLIQFHARSAGGGKEGRQDSLHRLKWRRCSLRPRTRS